LSIVLFDCLLPVSAQCNVTVLSIVLFDCLLPVSAQCNVTVLSIVLFVARQCTMQCYYVDGSSCSEASRVD